MDAIAAESPGIALRLLSCLPCAHSADSECYYAKVAQDEEDVVEIEMGHTHGTQC